MTLTQKQRRPGAPTNSRALSDYRVTRKAIEQARQIVIVMTNGRRWIAKNVNTEQEMFVNG